MLKPPVCTDSLHNMLTTFQDNNYGAIFSIFLEVKSLSISYNQKAARVFCKPYFWPKASTLIFTDGPWPSKTHEDPSISKLLFLKILQGPEIDFGQPYEVYIGKNCSLNSHSHLIHGANTNFEVPTKNFSHFIQIHSVLDVRECINLSQLNFCLNLRSALMHRMEVFGSLDRQTGLSSNLINWKVNLIRVFVSGDLC